MSGYLGSGTREISLIEEAGTSKMSWISNGNMTLLFLKTFLITTQLFIKNICLIPSLSAGDCNQLLVIKINYIWQAWLYLKHWAFVSDISSLSKGWMELFSDINPGRTQGKLILVPFQLVIYYNYSEATRKTMSDVELIRGVMGQSVGGLWNILGVFRSPLCNQL